MYEEKINELKKSKEDLEINLSQNIVNFKMKEDELDTLLIVIEGIMVYFINCRVVRERNMIIILRGCRMRRVMQ
jgi:hypothetical protein